MMVLSAGKEEDEAGGRCASSKPEPAAARGLLFALERRIERREIRRP
jgi:hypothetical protein